MSLESNTGRSPFSLNSETPLPEEEKMVRDDALAAFVAVVNVVRPPHPYHDSPYPVDPDDVDYGVTRTYLARCGPHPERSGYEVGYSTRLTFVNEVSRERHLAVLVHEVTHITAGSHSSNQHGSHPPRFWRKMALHAVLMYKSLNEGRLREMFPDADAEVFLREVINEPNKSTVDRRYWTVTECQREVADLVNSYKDVDFIRDIPLPDSQLSSL